MTCVANYYLKNQTIKKDTICLDVDIVRNLYRSQQNLDLYKQKIVIFSVKAESQQDSINKLRLDILDLDSVLTVRGKIISDRDSSITTLTEHDKSLSSKLKYLYIIGGLLMSIIISHFLGKFSIPNLLLSVFRK